MSGVMLHIADFAAPYPGAFITQLTMLDTELRRRGSGRCAFSFPPEAESAPWFAAMRAAGTWVQVLRTRPGSLGLASAREIGRAAAEVGASVLHTHFGTYDVSAVVAARRLRRQGHECRVLWHYRTALEEDLWRRPLRRQAKDLVKYRGFGSRTDGAVAVTNALAAEAAVRGLGAKATAVPAGCDTDAFRPDAKVRRRARAALGLSAGDVLVLHLGWAWYRKGGDLLVEAARLLHDRGRDNLVFLSVGAPQPAPPVRGLSFTDRIGDLHQAADIFVSASRSEGFGNGLVEAMAAGSVAVATSVTGQREVFPGTPGCIEVPPGDGAAIAAGIERLLGLRDRWPELGAANRQHVIAQHDMRSWARRMADFYERLLSPPQDVRR